MNRGTLAVLGLVLGVVAVGGILATRGSETEEDDETGKEPDDGEPMGNVSYKPGKGRPPGALAAGDPKDPEIAALLIELEDFLIGEGIPRDTWSAEEITRLPKGALVNGRRPVAIPVRQLWPNMVATLRLYRELRATMGVPLSLRGYRPPDYNKAVGGASSSTHQWFAALDVYPPGVDRARLGLEGAKLYLKHSGEAIGLGIYGKPNPSDIHLDTGKSRRTWREASYFLDKLKEA